MTFQRFPRRGCGNEAVGKDSLLNATFAVYTSSILICILIAMPLVVLTCKRTVLPFPHPGSIRIDGLLFIIGAMDDKRTITTLMISNLSIIVCRS